MQSYFSLWSANKALVQTAPALASFDIIARHNGFGGGVGAFLPHMARVRLHNAGVSVPVAANVMLLNVVMILGTLRRTTRRRIIMFPTLLEDAIARGEWKNPGYKALRIVLGLREGDAELELFETREIMEHIGRQLHEAGYVDDPEFCMIRDVSERHGSDDPRLIYSQALFIGGAMSPGEDVLLAVDISKPSNEQTVLWFDWSCKPPNRWMPIMSFASFLNALRTVETNDITKNDISSRSPGYSVDEEDFF